MNKGTNIMQNEYSFSVDMVHPKSWTNYVSDARHVEFVDKFVSKMNKKGFRAKVDTYRGPAGGAAVIKFDQNDKPIKDLYAYMSKFGFDLA